MTVYPVLQAFEKDQNKIIFAINQLARGLSAGGGGGGGTRESLTANRNYFVATAGGGGSDSNSGLSSGAPFLTVQKALDVVYGSLDLSGFDVTISIGAGTFSGALLIDAPQVGAGTIKLSGAGPTSTILTSTSITLRVIKNALLTVDNIKFDATGGNFCIVVESGGIVYGPNDGGTPIRIAFGAAAQSLMYAASYGTVSFTNTAYSLDANFTRHAWANGMGYVGLSLCKITIAAARTFSVFALADNLSYLEMTAMTFSGAGAGAGSTGKRYDVRNNAVLATNGGPTLPGTVAGTTTSGGVFY